MENIKFIIIGSAFAEKLETKFRFLEELGAKGYFTYIKSYDAVEMPKVKLTSYKGKSWEVTRETLKLENDNLDKIVKSVQGEMKENRYQACIIQDSMDYAGTKEVVKELAKRMDKILPTSLFRYVSPTSGNCGASLSFIMQPRGTEELGLQEQPLSIREIEKHIDFYKVWTNSVEDIFEKLTSMQRKKLKIQNSDDLEGRLKGAKINQNIDAFINFVKQSTVLIPQEAQDAVFYALSHEITALIDLSSLGLVKYLKK